MIPNSLQASLGWRLPAPTGRGDAPRYIDPATNVTRWSGWPRSSWRGTAAASARSLTDTPNAFPSGPSEIRGSSPPCCSWSRPSPAWATSRALPRRGQPARPRPPEQLGDYRILREVGRGGMGIVYEAEQESLGRHVALKVLPPHVLLNPRPAAAIPARGAGGGRLHHTNIVPVFGVGEQRRLHYYVMQFIQGQGLDEVLDELRRLQGGRPGRPAEAARCTRRRRPDVSA